MIVRTHFECEIENLVKACDLPAILELLAFLEKEKAEGINTESIRFNILNEKTGQSLLHVLLSNPPIEVPLPAASIEAYQQESAHSKWLKVFQWLFAQLKDDEIILSLDKQGRSLIWLAANYDQPEIGLMLTEHQAAQFATHECNATWLRADNEGVTPLHVAAQKPVSDLFRFLVDQKNLNAITADHDTALHLACRAKQFDNIGLLVKHGIDIYFSNKKGENFFFYFDGLAEAEKLAVFIKLSNEAQLNILNYYRKQLADKKLAEDKYIAIDALYTKLMEQRVATPFSLQALILSKMPYDPKAHFPTIDGLPDEALQVVPEYGNRVRKAERNKYSKSKFSIWRESLFAKKSPGTEKPEKPSKSFNVKNTNQILEEDRAGVREALNKANAFSTVLAGLSVYNPVDARFIVLAVLCTLGVIAGIGCFFYASAALVPFLIFLEGTAKATQLSLFLPIASFLVGTFKLPLIAAFCVELVISFAAFLGITISSFENMPSRVRYISQEETAELAKSLRHDVVDKLDRLKKQDAELLPIPKADCQKLKTSTFLIREAHSMTAPEMAKQVNTVKTHVETLLEVMSTERKSLSVVSSPEKIQKPVDPVARESVTAAPLSAAAAATVNVASAASVSVPKVVATVSSSTTPVPIVAPTPVATLSSKAAVTVARKSVLTSIAPKSTAQASHVALFQALRPKPIIASTPSNPLKPGISRRGSLNA